MKPSNYYLLIPGIYRKTKMYPYFGTDFGGSASLLNT
jgi:hypothetical protein